MFVSPSFVEMGNGGISARTWPEVPSEILKKDRKRDSPGKDRKKLPLAPGTLSTSVKRESLPKMEKRAMQLPDDIFTLDASQPRNPETKIHYAVESPTVPMTPKTPKMPAVVDASVHHDCAPRSRSNSKSISTTSSVNKITLKVILQSQSGRRSDTRKLVLPAITCATGLPTVAYGQLMDMVRQKFADRLVPSKVLLKYMDEDDDLITLTNQMDVDDFFQMNLENLNRLSISSREGASNMTLRLYVEGTDEDAEYKCTDSSLWTPQGSWSTATRVKGLGHWPQSLSQSLRLPSPPKSEEDLSSGLPEIRTQSPVPEPRKHSPEPRKHSPELSPCLKELVELESNCGANPRSTRRKKRNVSKCSTSDTEAGFPNAGQFLSHHLPERPSRQWSIGRLLGSGACAKVYRGMYTDNGQLVAVKQVEIQKQDQQNPYVQEDLTNLDREISSLRTLDHPMIVRYLGMEIDEREDMDFTVVNIFMELVGGASIACLLSEMGPFSEQVCQSYTCQILIGLGYLHDNDIVHRDIKGANIMVDRRGNIKLTDFGAAKRIADMLSKAEGGAASNLKGTIKWMAPEVCLGGGGSKASDVWSLGCTVVEMATGGSPFPDNDNQFSILFNIGMGKCDPLIPKSLSQVLPCRLRPTFLCAKLTCLLTL